MNRECGHNVVGDDGKGPCPLCEDKRIPVDFMKWVFREVLKHYEEEACPWVVGDRTETEINIDGYFVNFLIRIKSVEKVQPCFHDPFGQKQTRDCPDCRRNEFLKESEVWWSEHGGSMIAVEHGENVSGPTYYITPKEFYSRIVERLEREGKL